jgi:hypothetical protein
MKEKETSAMVDLAEQALKAYEQTFRTGLRIQEEASQWWNGVMEQAASSQDWRKRFTGLTGLTEEVMPAAQKRMEEMLDLTEKNAKTGAELVKKAVDAASSARIADSQTKWMDFWTSSLAATQANTQALMQLNTRALDAWLTFVQKSTALNERPAKAA